MNIGIVTTWFERGAAYVSRAYRDILSTKHQVFIYARGGEGYGIGDPNWDQDRVTWGKRVSGSPAVDIDWIPPVTDIDWADFKNWVSTHKLDVVIFNEEQYWDVILKCKKLDVAVGAYVDYYTAETIPFFGLYDFLLCNTRRHYSVFRNHPGAIYIPWGTDCSTFRPQWTARTNGDVRFFHSAGMGGINLRKGTDFLVKAFQRVQGNARLIIHSQVGVEKYGNAASLIRADSRIEFVEKTAGAPGLYHLGDVYVYPTRLEGIGLTIVEALACGLPVITTDEAPMNEFVENDRTGKLVPVSEYQRRQDQYYWPENICSVAELTTAMQFYVDHLPEVEKQKRQARDYALKHLDWQRNSLSLPDLIPGLAQTRRRSRRLQREIAQFERERRAELHMSIAFEHHRRGNSELVRRNLVRGVANNPRFLRNRGVWSIGADAFSGRRIANLLRSLTFRAKTEC